MDWGTLLATLIGLAAGSGLGLASTLLTAAHAARRERERSEQQAKFDHDRWRRDRVVEALERAFESLGAIVVAGHPEHERWKRELATSNLIVRLYCGELLQGAFSSVRAGMVLVSENEASVDGRAMLVLGEATKYLQVAARCELGIEGTHEDVKEARDGFLRQAQLRRASESD